MLRKLNELNGLVGSLEVISHLVELFYDIFGILICDRIFSDIKKSMGNSVYRKCWAGKRNIIYE
jgi:hypothetical protein